MNKVTVSTAFKTINIERGDGSLELRPYIAVDTKKKWYLCEGMFSGMYAIRNYETNAFICGFYKGGAIHSIQNITMADLPAITKLYSQLK